MGTQVPLFNWKPGLQRHDEGRVAVKALLALQLRQPEGSVEAQVWQEESQGSHLVLSEESKKPESQEQLEFLKELWDLQETQSVAELHTAHSPGQRTHPVPASYAPMTHSHFPGAAELSALLVPQEVQSLLVPAEQERQEEWQFWQFRLVVLGKNPAEQTQLLGEFEASSAPE